MAHVERSQTSQLPLNTVRNLRWSRLELRLPSVQNYYFGAEICGAGQKKVVTYLGLAWFKLGMAPQASMLLIDNVDIVAGPVN